MLSVLFYECDGRNGRKVKGVACSGVEKRAQHLAGSRQCMHT
jgi:hypothetical protein